MCITVVRRLASLVITAEFDPLHYVGYASVANTLYRLFGVAPERMWKAVRNGPNARTLNGLLS